MKTKTTILILCLLGAWQVTGAQQIVWDPTVTSTLVLNHRAQQEKLLDIRNNESRIMVAQTFISRKVEQIREIEQKMHERLKTVSTVVKDGKNIVYASAIARDIGKYQGQMIDHAKGNNALLIVAYQTEKALIERTADLFTYISGALVGGDFNLLDNKQRHDIILHVVNELRAMRGLAYGVARRMRIARRAGIWKTLNPFDVNYPNRDAELVEGILKNL